MTADCVPFAALVHSHNIYRFSNEAVQAVMYCHRELFWAWQYEIVCYEHVQAQLKIVVPDNEILQYCKFFIPSYSSIS